MRDANVFGSKVREEVLIGATWFSTELACQTLAGVAQVGLKKGMLQNYMPPREDGEERKRGQQIRPVQWYQDDPSPPVCLQYATDLVAHIFF